MSKELSGMAIHRKRTTQRGKPDDTTEAKMLAKKSDAVGLKMFVRKPVFPAAKGEMSFCCTSASEYAPVDLDITVLIPR